MKRDIMVVIAGSALVSFVVIMAWGANVPTVASHSTPALVDEINISLTNLDGQIDGLSASGVGGVLASGKIIVGVGNVATPVDVSGAASIATNGAVTLAGNIALARITNAVATAASLPTASLTGNKYSGSIQVASSVGGSNLVFVFVNGVLTNTPYYP